MKKFIDKSLNFKSLHSTAAITHLPEIATTLGWGCCRHSRQAPSSGRAHDKSVLQMLIATPRGEISQRRVFTYGHVDEVFFSLFWKAY